MPNASWLRANVGAPLGAVWAHAGHPNCWSPCPCSPLPLPQTPIGLPHHPVFPHPCAHIPGQVLVEPWVPPCKYKSLLCPTCHPITDIRCTSSRKSSKLSYCPSSALYTWQQPVTASWKGRTRAKTRLRLWILSRGEKSRDIYLAHKTLGPSPAVCVPLNTA